MGQRLPACLCRSRRQRLTSDSERPFRVPAVDDDDVAALQGRRRLGNHLVRIGLHTEGAGGAVRKDVGGLDGAGVHAADSVHDRQRPRTGRHRLGTADGADVGVADRGGAPVGSFHGFAEGARETRQMFASVGAHRGRSVDNDGPASRVRPQG